MTENTALTACMIHVINPAAGQGHAPSLLPEDRAGLSVYYTSGVGDAERFAYETCLTQPDAHFCVYGGDGTVNEVVNGILRANAGKTAALSLVAAGTGNDLIRSVPDEHGSKWVDVIRYNDRYAVNVLNTGFDCRVAARIERLKRKPLISGSFAYVVGVMRTLLGGMGRQLKVTLTDEQNQVHTIEQNTLLCAVGNGSFYGGGFRALPMAKTDDGFLELILVRKMSRTRFLSMVGQYREGTHFDQTRGTVSKKFQKVIQYFRCRSLCIEGMDLLCADGEVAAVEKAEISVLPKAIHLVW